MLIRIYDLLLNLFGINLSNKLRHPWANSTEMIWLGRALSLPFSKAVSHSMWSQPFHSLSIAFHIAFHSLGIACIALTQLRHKTWNSVHQSISWCERQSIASLVDYMTLSPLCPLLPMNPMNINHKKVTLNTTKHWFQCNTHYFGSQGLNAKMRNFFVIICWVY